MSGYLDYERASKRWPGTGQGRKQADRGQGSMCNSIDQGRHKVGKVESGCLEDVNNTIKEGLVQPQM